MSKQKIYYIPKAKMLSLLEGGKINSDGFLMVAVPAMFCPLPSDAKVHSFFLDYSRQAVGLVIESNEFEEVPDGCKLPVAETQIMVEMIAAWAIRVRSGNLRDDLATTLAEEDKRAVSTEPIFHASNPL